MAEGRHLENQISDISPERSDRSLQN